MATKAINQKKRLAMGEKVTGMKKGGKVEACCDGGKMPKAPKKMKKGGKC